MRPRLKRKNSKIPSSKIPKRCRNVYINAPQFAKKKREIEKNKAREKEREGEGEERVR